MLNIKFTDWNTVILKNGLEISNKKFFQEMEANIEDDNYNVYLDEEKNKYCIRFRNESYELPLSDGIIENQYVYQKLTSLSQLEKMYGSIYGNNINDMQDILDDNAKKMYLKKIVNSKKFSFKKIKDYFKNLVEDIKTSFEDSIDFLECNIWPFTECSDLEDYGCLFLMCLCIAFLVGILPAMIILNSKTVVSSWIWVLLAAWPQTVFLAIPISYIITHIINRSKRLKEYINNKKMTTEKIQTLQKLITSNTEEKVSEIINDKQNIKNSILIEINKLVDLLDVMDDNRKKYFATEIKKVLKNYGEIIKKNKEERELFQGKGNVPILKDNEIALKTDIMGEISRLELEMLAVIKLNEKIDSRDLEIKKIDDRLDMVLENSKTLIKKNNLINN